MIREIYEYKYCYSLGWYCGIAIALEYNGLRRYSGPFDWYFSDYPSVLSMMDTDFQDFLDINNLQVESHRKEAFDDVKYGFRYVHDVKHDFDSEYTEIYEKYQRRINRFREAIKQPTCFFHAFRSNVELKFISENNTYINYVIKKTNHQNSVIYLLLNNMEVLENEECYYLGLDEYPYDPYQIATLFEKNTQLVNRCKELLSKEDIQNNIYFFENGGNHLNLKVGFLLKDINTVKKIESIIGNRDLYLWGAGHYGEKTLSLLQNSSIKVLGIIDNDFNKQNENINGTPIIPFKNLTKSVPIFIDLGNEEYCKDIKQQILAENPTINVFGWQDVLQRYPLKRTIRN